MRKKEKRKGHQKCKKKRVIFYIVQGEFSAFKERVSSTLEANKTEGREREKGCGRFGFVKANAGGGSGSARVRASGSSEVRQSPKLGLVVV